jgi:Ca-activated chloride channel homolog
MTRNQTLTARSDRRYVRSTHRSERFVLVELEAPASAQTATRDPVNLAFVLDRSGSMSGQKIELAKRAIATAVDRLLPTDRFSIVSYDDRIDVVVEATSASREAKTNAIERLRSIDARGSTDLAGGWLRGAEQVALAVTGLPGASRRAPDPGTGGDGHGRPEGTAASAPAGPNDVHPQINRVLVLTDGLANVGIVDAGEIARHAGELRARGVTTTTFGVGEDFDEGLLQSMADAGGGHFYFIANAAQIQDHIATEVGELLQVVARDASLEITAPETLEITTLSPYPMDRRGARHHVLLGDLVAEQRLEVLLRIRFGYGPIGQEIGLLVGASDREGVLAGAAAGGTGRAVSPVGVGWEYADDRTNDGQPRDRSVDRAVARLFVSRARQNAIALNRVGDYTAAARGLRGVAERVAGYAGSDPELRGLIAALREEEHRWSAPAPESSRKVAFAAASYSMRNRSQHGGANR